jgi:hypothetical protein
MDTNQARLKEGGTIKDQTPADACEDSYSDDDIPDLVPDDPIPNHLVASEPPIPSLCLRRR